MKRGRTILALLEIAWTQPGLQSSLQTHHRSKYTRLTRKGINNKSSAFAPHHAAHVSSAGNQAPPSTVHIVATLGYCHPHDTHTHEFFFHGGCPGIPFATRPSLRSSYNEYRMAEEYAPPFKKRKIVKAVRPWQEAAANTWRRKAKCLRGGDAYHLRFPPLVDRNNARGRKKKSHRASLSKFRLPETSPKTRIVTVLLIMDAVLRSSRFGNAGLSVRSSPKMEVPEWQILTRSSHRWVSYRELWYKSVVKRLPLIHYSSEPFTDT